MRRGSVDSIRASGQKAPHQRPDTKLQSACPSYSNRSLRSGRRPYKGHVGQHVGLRVVHDGGELGDLRADLVGDRAPLHARGFRRLLGEGGGNEGRDDPPPALAGMGEHVAHEVDAASLPGGAEDAGRGSLQALVVVGDHQPHAAQPAPGEAAQELGPEGLGLGCADLHAQHLALTATATVTATETMRPVWRTFT